MRDPERIYPADTFEGRVLRGDPDALGEVVRWVAQVLATPRFWRLRPDWPDLHQECLRRVLTSLHEARFDASRGFKAYVQSLARYTALEASDRLPRSYAAPTAAASFPHPLEAEDDAVRHLLARAVMDRVPAECRKLFELFFYEQRSHGEIAEAMAIPLGTVKSRIFRCVQSAHRLLGSALGRARRQEVAE